MAQTDDVRTKRARTEEEKSPLAYRQTIMEMRDHLYKHMKEDAQNVELQLAKLEEIEQFLFDKALQCCSSEEEDEEDGDE